jgi:hypothetical protein
MVIIISLYTLFSTVKPCDIDMYHFLISLNTIIQLTLVMVKCCVFSEVGTEILNII